LLVGACLTLTGITEAHEVHAHIARQCLESPSDILAEILVPTPPRKVLPAGTLPIVRCGDNPITEILYHCSRPIYDSKAHFIMTNSI
jgi:hypothetical protein